MRGTGYAVARHGSHLVAGGGILGSSQQPLPGGPALLCAGLFAGPTRFVRSVAAVCRAPPKNRVNAGAGAMFLASPAEQRQWKRRQQPQQLWN